MRRISFKSSTILYLAIIPVILINSIIGFYLYSESLQSKKSLLLKEAQTLSLMISSVAIFDQKFSAEEAFQFNTYQATLHQVKNSFKKITENQKDYEYLLGQFDGNTLKFIAYSHRQPPTVNKSTTNVAVPMRKALAGESGTIIEHDYHGNRVFAAYVNVPGTPWGLVVKQAFIHHVSPFINSVIIFISLSTILIIGIYYFMSRYRNKKETLIANSEQRFKQLVESTEDWVWEVNEKAEYTYSSSQVENILGYKAEEIIGKTPFELMDREQVESIKQTFARIVSNLEAIVDLENTNRHKQGHVVHILTNGSPFLNPDGSLAGYRGIDKDISLLKAKQYEVEQLAFYDNLTNLPNRRTCLDKISQEIEFVNRSDFISALLFLDLDGFKIINDSLGHEQGDQVLIIIAQRLLSQIRKFDTAGRVGGDEFIILLRGSDNNVQKCEQTIKEFVSRLTTTINEPIELMGHTFHIGISIGIALIPLDGDSPEQLIRHADSAMYSAKKLGKNQARFYEIKLQNDADKLMELKVSIASALEKDEFELYYQPQFNVDGSQIVGYEALIRWIKEGEIISPAKFLPYINTLGFELLLDKWVINRAFKDSLTLLSNDKHQHISINICSTSLEHESFIPFISEKIEAYHLKAGNFTLEMTENIMMLSNEKSFTTINEIKRMGFHFSIDDFGTGYSSLSYLSDFNFDEIKIDKKFVSGIESDQTDRTICSMIINLARSMGARVVAEGVETDEQLNYLIEQDVNIIQGYIYHKPVSLEFLKIKLQIN